MKIFRVRRFETLNSRKELALTFHYLSQLHLVKNSETKLDKLYGLMLSLNAANLAEAAGILISAEHLVDIYVGVILRIRSFTPSWLRMTRKLYFGLARKVKLSTVKEMPARIRWIFSSYGSRFFLVRGKVDYRSGAKYKNMFCQLENEADPMSYVLKVYKEHLMRKAIQILLSPGQKSEMYEINNYTTNVRFSQIPDALSYVNLLLETVSSTGNFL